MTGTTLLLRNRAVPVLLFLLLALLPAYATYADDRFILLFFTAFWCSPLPPSASTSSSASAPW